GIFNYGLLIDGANSQITSGGGDVEVEGQGGGDSGSGSLNVGIRLGNAGQITSGGNGTVSVTGTGGPGPGNDLYGILISGAQITSGGSGKVSVSATGGSGPGIFNYGLVIDGANSQITSGGGDVEVEGQGGGDSGSGSLNVGIRLANAGQITSGGNGAVSVTGTGGPGTGNDIYGILIITAAQITSGGSGKVSVSGTGGSGPGIFNYGLVIDGSNSQITSGGGDVEVEGQGGGDSGSGSQNAGILLANAGQITSGGNGAVSVTGTGGQGTGSDNYGLVLRDANTQITSSGGAVMVTGTGGGAASFFNYGIVVGNGAVITNAGSGATATVTVIGQGGDTSGAAGGNYGIHLDGQITSNGGIVSVTGIGNDNSEAIRLLSNGMITSGNNADIFIIADGINLITPGLINSGTGTTTIRPLTAATLINLGGADVFSSSPSTLGLTDTELDQVAAGTLVLGTANSGNITISAAISRPAATNVELRSGGDILFNQSFDTGGGDLLLAPGTSPAAVYPTFGGTDATASTLSFASDLAIVINGTTPGNGTGSTYTQLTVAGVVDLTGVDLVLTGSPTLVGSETFTIVDNDGTDAITGVFVGLPESTTIPNFLSSGLDATISYLGGDGNDVVITVQTPLPPDYTITTVGNAIVVTDVAGNGDVLDVTENGGSINFAAAGRTYSLDGGFAMNFPVDVPLAGVTSITIDGAVGNDVINVGAFTANLPSLTIDGGSDTDNVQFNGAIAYASDANLQVMNAEIVIVNGPQTTSGTGSIDLAANQSITVNARLTSAAGNINLSTIGGQDILVQGGINSVNAAGGTATLQAGQDLLLGSAVSFGDVRGQTLALTAGRDIIVSATTFAQGDGAGGASVTAGRNLTVTGNSVINTNAGGAPNSLTTGVDGVFTVSSGSSIGANNGPLTVTADEVAISGTLGTIGIVTVRPLSVGRSIDLGTNTPGQLSLSAAELNQLSAGTLIIGRNDISTGTITVSSSIAPAGTSSLSLISSAAITGTGAIAETNVALRAVTGINLSGDNAIANLAAVNTTSGNISFNNTSTDLAVSGAAINGLSGVTAAGQTVNLTTTSSGNIALGLVTGETVTINSAGNITGGGTTNISANSANLAAVLNVGAIIPQIFLDVNTVTATSGSGDLGLRDVSGDLTVNNATANGGGTARITVDNGDLNINTVSAQFNVGLFAVNGSIFDANGSSTNNISSSIVEAQAATGIELDIMSQVGSFQNTGTGDIILRRLVGGLTISNGGISTNDGDVLISVSNGTLLLNTFITANGDINLIANALNALVGSSVNAGMNTTTIRPQTAATQINLGGADAGGILGLTDAELDRITTGTLIIGDANSGAITISAAISLPAATDVELRSGGDILFNQSFDTGGGDLLLAPGTSPAAVYPTFNGTDATAGTLSFASDLAIVINGTTPGNGTGSTYTQLTVVGAIDLSGVDLVLSGSPTLMGIETFLIVDNDGADAITGTFNGLPEGAVISNFLGSGLDATITYLGGDGNDVALDVIDSIDPTAICQDVTVQLDANGEGVTTAAAVDNGSNDASGIASLALDQTEFSCADVDTPVTVTLTVTDNNDNSSTCTATVTVFDTIAPTVMANDTTLYLDENGLAELAVEDYHYAVSDNCIAEVTNIFRLPNTSSLMTGSGAAAGAAKVERAKFLDQVLTFTCDDVGNVNLQVEIEATDGSGNVTLDTIIVTILDTITPVIVCEAITVALDSTGTATIENDDAVVSITDNCPDNLSGPFTVGGPAARTFDCSFADSTFQ
ncbi:hypothetical protein H9S92_17770, partial [Lewinella lacunae]|nr:hypothetical protein [Neolewinella lacunae]